MNEIVDFDELLTRYKKEALLVDLKKTEFLVYETFERNKMKVNNATFENEINDLIVLFETAVIDIKSMLHTAIINEHYKGGYPNGNPNLLMQIKCYFEYYELYQKAIDKKRLIQQLNTPEPEPLDLSDTSAVEKIIYLNELGIIDFLRTKPEFMGSTNLMATVLSAVTGEKVTTLQTSLNKLINEDTDDKNHPYKTTKTVEKVRQTLIGKNIKRKVS
jgi:hypothetical protein